MPTPLKPAILALVELTDWGEANVVFPDVDLSGSIRRTGRQSYIAFAENGIEAGRAARYESAARALARHLGLRNKHMINVEIVDSIPRRRACP
jgi:hypothetical protein